MVQDTITLHIYQNQELFWKFFLFVKEFKMDFLKKNLGMWTCRIPILTAISTIIPIHIEMYPYLHKSLLRERVWSVKMFVTRNPFERGKLDRTIYVQNEKRDNGRCQIPGLILSTTMLHSDFYSRSNRAFYKLEYTLMLNTYNYGNRFFF